MTLKVGAQSVPGADQKPTTRLLQRCAYSLRQWPFSCTGTCTAGLEGCSPTPHRLRCVMGVQIRKSCQDVAESKWWPYSECKPIKNYFSTCGERNVKHSNPLYNCYDGKATHCPGECLVGIGWLAGRRAGKSLGGCLSALATPPHVFARSAEVFDTCERENLSLFVGPYDKFKQVCGAPSPYLISSGLLCPILWQRAVVAQWAVSTDVWRSSRRESKPASAHIHVPSELELHH